MIRTLGRIAEHEGWKPAIIILNFVLVVGARTSAQATPTPTAQYQVHFDGTWSAATHPLTFPPGPHFSSLIGGTHDASVHFWALGELASTGIRDMAERGRTTPLDLEVQAAIDAGHAGTIILGGGISPSPGSVSTTFTISLDFPLVTLVSMIAPTPDWFVGVNGLSLLENGDWAGQVVVSLWAYDAGTDSGTDYTSPNLETIPRQPIALNPAPPFANGTPLGTFTFTRLDVPSQAAEPATGRGPGRAFGFPNPFQRTTGVHFALPKPECVVVSVYDAVGRKVNELHSGHLGAGAHFLPWDGTDTRGAHAGSGIYFIRVESPDRTLTAKVVRVD